MQTESNRLLTTHEVGRLLQMDPSSIAKWVNDGLLRAFLTPGGHRRIRAADLVDFLREHRMYIPPELPHPGLRVVIVHDDPRALRAIQRDLNRDGIEVEVCRSGIEGLVRVGATNPALLVIDLEATGVNALEVLHRLKAAPETTHICVVVISPVAPSFDLQVKAKALGAHAVLARPISAATIRQVVPVLERVG